MKREKLSPQQIESELQSRPDWSIHEGKLFRKFEFDDFTEAWGFMSMVALHAQRLDHHPEWRNVYSMIEVRLFTHDIAGLTEFDFALADEMDIAFLKIR